MESLKLPFICLIQILGVEGLLGTDNGWPYLLGIALFPSILQMSLLPFCPESPRYLLITRQREQDAREGKFIDARTSEQLMNYIFLGVAQIWRHGPRRGVNDFVMAVLWP